MRVARAFRFPITAIMAALALSGCMRTTGPVAIAPQGDLDAMAYGRRRSPLPAVVVDNCGGGAISALRACLAAPVARRAGARRRRRAGRLCRARRAYDAAYHLDAGDKLRVVVYGQEGLTNTYAIDAGGSITMPLIGSVPARGCTPPTSPPRSPRRLRDGFIREPSVAVEIEAYRPFFILGEVAAPGQYPYVPNMTVESAVAIAGGFSPRAQRPRASSRTPMRTGRLSARRQAAVPLGDARI